MKAKRRDILNDAAGLLNEGIASGEFRKMDVAGAVVFLESLLQGYCHVRFWHDKAISAKAATDIIHDLFLQGVGKKDRPAKGVLR